MSLTLKELMRKSGVTLKDVSGISQLPVPIVCNVLNDELVKRVRKDAMDIIISRGRETSDLVKTLDV